MKIKIINTTTDSEKIASHIAESLVANNLSPCVQIISNIKSVYSWRDELIKSEEIMLIIKTIQEKVSNCKKLIQKLHNYDSPELIISDGEILDDEYRDWFVQNCREI